MTPPPKCNIALCIRVGQVVIKCGAVAKYPSIMEDVPDVPALRLLAARVVVVGGVEFDLGDASVEDAALLIDRAEKLARICDKARSIRHSPGYLDAVARVRANTITAVNPGSSYRATSLSHNAIDLFIS